MAESPRITSLAWGRMEVEGLGSFKDCKLWPGGGRAWDWRETGTDHRPGVQLADVEEVLAHGAEAVVLSTGMTEALGVDPATLPSLAARGIQAEVLPTEAAVERYNELAEGVAVGGLFHSTC